MPFGKESIDLKYFSEVDFQAALPDESDNKRTDFKRRTRPDDILKSVRFEQRQKVGMGRGVH